MIAVRRESIPRPEHQNGGGDGRMGSLSQSSTWTEDKYYWVYILASRIGGTLYIGVTNDLVRRVYEHQTRIVPGFTKRYGVHRLVYYEQFSDIEFAIQREKRLKKWNRRYG
jgi:putative endonuclease